MNDTNFVNYDNYFCTTTTTASQQQHQMTDVNLLIQNMDYDVMPQTIHYINNVSCDMAAATAVVPLSQTTAVDTRHHQQQANLFNYLSHPPDPDEQEKLEENDSSNISRVANTSNGVVANASAGGVFGNIPFVQIHTTNVEPQRTSYGNVFRRNISKQDEIKSEPIKSENAEAAKERTNATPTPPRASSQTQNEGGIEQTQSTIESSRKSNNNTDNNPSSLTEIYKCSKCPYLSLSETQRNEHLSAQHLETDIPNNVTRQDINCPGCSNIFFVKESLELHLKLDHFMHDNEILKLINYLIKTKIPKELVNNSNSASETSDPINVADEQKEPQRKSRIYLKNVECLREPNRHAMEQTENQFSESINCNNKEVTTRSNAPKQKISIKSVDVLREPALLRRDYQMQNSDFNSKNYINYNADLINSNNSMEIINNPMGLNVSTAYDYGQNLETSMDNSNNINNNEPDVINSNITNNENESAEKPRRPKIYVKSVESFNLMPLGSIHSNNNGLLNDHSNLCSTNQVYDTNMVHLPFIFDSNSAPNNNLTNNNNNNNYINNHNDMDSFQFIPNSTQNNSYILENTLFLTNADDVNIDAEQMENITLIPEPTPSPPLISDVNLVMNKPPHPSQEHRGTLHLRTVDELNLMNKTEVQHLIAPNLDNNHNNETMDKTNSTSLNDINIIGAELYEDDNFKFDDLDTEMVNDWPDAYDDLADDINCIIADASNENSEDNLACALEDNQKILNTNNFDIDTPQVSLITIRDIEELTGTSNHQELLVEQLQYIDNEGEQTQHVVQCQDNLFNTQSNDENDNNLKRELSNATPESNEITLSTEVIEEILSPEASSNDVPPLAPVTNAAVAITSPKNSTTNDIPVPPLVPVSPAIKTNKTLTEAPTAATKVPAEKGRIYVANNLMEPPKRALAVTATSGTSVRGRPFGSNRTRITQLKQTHGSSAEDLFAKCSIKGCAFRFKKTETVEYHRKCHDMASDSPQAMLCPECKSTEYTNWNTLHTHLWRAHQIDMELYKCELCEFKTPIFSRLVNTHAKIHFDDRNYKCEQCDKAFKNSKQLKNHRRWHRVQAASVAASSATAQPKEPPPPIEIHQCPDCGATFSQQKSRREHCCKKGETSLKCTVCEKLMSSKASLKLHLLTHSDGEKRYKCQSCDYTSNDHNAYRRHRMGHENRKMYECGFCPYKSVQSVAYQKHILHKHPDKADSIVHKCNVCTFSTIKRSLLVVHQAKHGTPTEDHSKTNNMNDNADNEPTKDTEKTIAVATELQRSKIKVKSNLFTTDIETLVNFNKNDINLVQLYNIDNSIT